MSGGNSQPSSVESLLEAAFCASPLATALVDHRGQFVACNEAYCELAGWPERELIGSEFSRLLHPEEAEGAEVAFRRFLGGGEASYDAYRRLVRADGSERLVRTRVRAARELSPPIAVAIIEDVSADGRSLGAVVRREERFRALIENATDLVTVAHPEGRIIYQSPSVSRILGWTMDELAGQGLFDLLHPLDKARCEEAFAHLISGGEPIALSYRVRHKDGSWRVVEATGTNLLDEPSVGGIVINADDITERHETQDQLLQAEARYRALVEQMPLVVYATSAANEGEVLYISPQVVQLLGYPLEKWRSGRGLWEQLLHPDDRERVISEMAAQRARSDRIRSEYRMIAENGHTVWVLDEMRLLRGNDGAPQIYQGFLLDMTERETLQEQLRHAQRLEAIGRLAGGIAHDFNNLLLGIVGYSEFASRANAIADHRAVQENIERALAAVERAKLLTRQLLAFSRRQVLREEPIDVSAAITETASLLRRLLGEDIEIELEIVRDLGFVVADPAQFEQLLMNLALNARDAMPDGGTLTFSATLKTVIDHERLPQGTYVAITVSDTGHGMDSETLMHLFEPFFTTKPKDKGTGLGLASAHGFVSQSSGEINVSSTVGVGTSFEVLFPSANDASALSKRRTPAALASTDTPASIVLVEDDDAVRSVVQQMLQGAGHSVRSYCCADQAIEAVQTGGIDVVITDLVMPNTSGVRFARELRHRHDNVKIVLISGHSDESIDPSLLSDPSVAFVQKPFSASDLSAVVDGMLRA